MPIGCSDDEFPWGKESLDPLENKYLYVCHAEANAILNKNNFSIKGTTIYTTLFPCNQCAKIIIQVCLFFNLKLIYIIFIDKRIFSQELKKLCI